jgi:hypothetical protein
MEKSQIVWYLALRQLGQGNAGLEPVEGVKGRSMAQY